MEHQRLILQHPGEDIEKTGTVQKSSKSDHSTFTNYAMDCDRVQTK
jgi:hypothetical protein